VPRVAGTLEGPNQLAGYLEAALPLLWVAPLLLGRLPSLYALVCALSSAALVLTESRAGVLVVGLAYVWFSNIRAAVARLSLRWILAGSALGIIIIGGWLFFWAHASVADIDKLMRLTSLQPPGGVGTRSQLWHAAWQLFVTHPLTGVGAGNYELLLRNVGLRGIETQAGSLWLQTLAEQGVIGLVALLLFAGTALRATHALRYQSPLALAAFLALASLLAHQLVDDLFFFPKAAELAWLLLGAGTATPLIKAAGATVLSVTVKAQPSVAQQPVPEPT